MISRRSFLGQAAATSLIATCEAAASARPRTVPRRTFVDLLRQPDAVTAFAGLSDSIRLQRSGGRFVGRDVAVSVDVTGDAHADEHATEAHIRLTAPKTALTHVHLRWSGAVSPTLLCLGDHWERSYGDLAWRGMTPERVMPWYFATYDGSALHSYGVKTGAGALCFWQIDPEGVSLWLDVSNGGDGVLLGDRELPAAVVVTRGGTAGEAPITAQRAFCKQMCPAPLLPEHAVYGTNDWYCAYGKNSQEMLLRIADLTAEVSPGAAARPFTVVDMGWKENSAAFPSMAAYAEQVHKRGVRPGIWIRPLEAVTESGLAVKDTLLLPARRFGERAERFHELAYDPTIPDALALVEQKMRQLAGWNFDLVKHDFSTYDLLGQWGFEMGAQPSIPGWHFHDRSRTNAEIILDFYRFLRKTLGPKIQILGCNTIGHLGAGVFELQRTGDDTSGRIWERTRRMGVNTLAHRLAQHRTFFHLDADCVGITKAIPWELNRQWLDLLARSGTALFVSPDISPENGAIGPEQRTALKEAFALATAPDVAAVPEDCFHETTPEIWNTGKGVVQHYRWCATDGASPFGV